jgi:hypothetical protein
MRLNILRLFFGFLLLYPLWAAANLDKKSELPAGLVKVFYCCQVAQVQNWVCSGTKQAPSRYKRGPFAVQKRPRQGFWLQAKSFSPVAERLFACSRKAFYL